MSAEIHALSGAYAIDALSSLERVEFEAHLATCAACRDEVASLRETSALLGTSAAVAPPASVREAVLAGITGVRPLPPVVSTEPDSPVAHLRRHWQSILVAAAAAILVIVGGAAIWDPWSAEQVSVADQVLDAPDATRSSARIGQSTVTLVRSVALGKAVVVSDDLTLPPDGRAYELWLQSPTGDMLPAGLLPRSTQQKFLLIGDAATATAAGITDEPVGGSDAPTTTPLVLFPFVSVA
jgi:anti-sigma factor RsiW